MNLSDIQIVVLIVYLGYTTWMFFHDWYSRGKITLGSIETTLVPAAIILILVFFFRIDFVYIPALAYLGVVLYLLGTIIGASASKQLGNNIDDFWFSRHTNKERHLVADGLYSYVRHPLFISIITVYLGLILVFLHPITVALWILLIFFCVVTAAKEEKFLEKRFPEYSDYAKRVGGFFPKL